MRAFARCASPQLHDLQLLLAAADSSGSGRVAKAVVLKACEKLRLVADGDSIHSSEFHALLDAIGPHGAVDYAQLCRYIDTYEREPSPTAAVVQKQNFAFSAAEATRITVEVFVVLWGRVVDPWELQEVVQELTTTEQALIMRRVGPLHLCRFTHAERFYFVDLSQPDGMVTAKMLAELTAAEQGVWTGGIVDGKPTAGITDPSGLPTKGMMQLWYTCKRQDNELRRKFDAKTFLGRLKFAHETGATPFP
jgi:hypothetical protein